MNIRKLFRPKRCDIEIHLDREKEVGMDIFWVHDARKKTEGSVGFGDVIIDLDKKGNIVGFEILNADRLGINLEEQERILKMLEEKEC